MGYSYSTQKAESLLNKQTDKPEQEPPVVASPPLFTLFEYVVQHGDTLFSIAYNHGVTIRVLKSLNLHLNQDGYVFVGDVVFVPLKN